MNFFNFAIWRTCVLIWYLQCFLNICAFRSNAVWITFFIEFCSMLLHFTTKNAQKSPSKAISDIPWFFDRFFIVFLLILGSRLSPKNQKQNNKSQKISKSMPPNALQTLTNPIWSPKEHFLMIFYDLLWVFLIFEGFWFDFI